jgi:splicing factor 3B subunit 2
LLDLVSIDNVVAHMVDHTEEESEEEEEEEEEEESAEPTAMDGLQTPSGMETPSGMASVVSTVAGGLETPDFLELRKNAGRAESEAVDSGPRSLYQVVPEKQTSVRGLMGSERGYDVSAVANPGASIPVLGDERGSKVRWHIIANLLCLLNYF